MNLLREFLIFSCWAILAQSEVGGESYEFSKVDLESVTILIVLRSLFGLQN